MTESPHNAPTVTSTQDDDVVAAPGERFSRVEGRRWGYDPQDVDEFLSRAESGEELTSSELRQVIFGRARGGYEPAEVDAALDTVENTLAKRENHAYITAHGRESWEEQVGALSDLIFGRLERPDGQRFRRPSGVTTRGYAVVDVDALCHAIVEELSTADAIHPDRVRTAVFGPASGESAYEEQQVDAFLDKLVELLLALR
ncbi:DivIVA domain-containing protein [Kocuria sp.]|uniref:DivIVA domain-containing protein n=1 Tax=Kocuria sp. TaxID=1871328 RepID=UPI0026E04330|nr:DivIVA domain-containing protein [Kocuria sp.]MDO5618796.1 DivIVA domain-containing protein [Kocuria sp.]